MLIRANHRASERLLTHRSLAPKSRSAHRKAVVLRRAAETRQALAPNWVSWPHKDGLNAGPMESSEGTCMITAKHIPWEPIGTLPEDRKDGRRLLLWEADLPVIGRWDSDREDWEDPESMHILDEVTYWADINPPV